MGFVNFNKVNPHKLEFVYPGLFYKHNDKWICLATNCKTNPMIDSEPGFRYLDTTFKPVKEDTANGIQD